MISKILICNSICLQTHPNKRQYSTGAHSTSVDTSSGSQAPVLASISSPSSQATRGLGPLPVSLSVTITYMLTVFYYFLDSDHHKYI